jgi:DNA (cytosine-5)-methyltransferase 1
MNRYAELLDAAWADHLAPRREDAPTVISTFAGCGGSSLGYSMAGCRTLLAVEWDRNAVDTYRRNFRHTLVHHGDIAALGVTDVLARTGLRSGELDVLDGSPTCQGFSTAGKRAIDDPRNQLFRGYARLLRGLEPRVFVMENVSGLVKGKMKLLFAEILRELKACGYRVSARLLNAMYFNVPQSRERMIFIGVREDLGIEPSHPKAQSRPLTLREALVPPPDPGSHGGNVSELRARRWSETRRGSKHHERFSLNRLSWSKPAPTILRVSDSGGHMHPDTPRLLSTGELQRCASFPDGFEFIGGWSDSVERIGNSVPPLFMRAIARHVDSVILAKAASHLSGET